MNKLVELNAPTKQTSIISNKTTNKQLLTPVYQAVKSPTIKIKVDNIINGKFVVGWSSKINPASLKEKSAGKHSS